MSKLAKAIDATLTRNVRASRDLKLNYTTINLLVNESVSTHNLSKELLLSVKIAKQCWYNESDDLNDVLHDIKRAMIEEVFGEFRPLLIEIRGSLYDEDTIRAKTLLAELEDQMFRDGL